MRAAVCDAQVQECETECPCAAAAGREGGASACCVWRATVASHKPRVDGRPGCGLELNMPDEDGNPRSAAEITLGIGYRALAHGLDAEARCAELSQGSEVFFAGEGAAPVALLL